MKTIKHIIWDWNGTLLDDAQVCVECLNTLLTRRCKQPVTLSEYRAQFGFPVKRYYEELGINFDTEDWNMLAEEFHELYLQKFHNTHLRKNVPEILMCFSRNGIKMSILSASEKTLLEDALHRFMIRDYFYHIQAREDYYAESKLELGTELVQCLCTPTQNIVLIGDTTHDYEVATVLGLSCILIGGGHHSNERLRQCNCIYASDISDLSRIILTSIP